MNKTVTIMGRRSPLVALVGAVGVLGFLVVMRMRSKKAAVATPAVATAATTAGIDPTTGQLYSTELSAASVGASAGTPDYTSQLAVITSQLDALQTVGLNPAPAPPPSGALNGGPIIAGPNSPVGSIIVPLPAQGPGLFQPPAAAPAAAPATYSWVDNAQASAIGRANLFFQSGSGYTQVQAKPGGGWNIPTAATPLFRKGAGGGHPAAGAALTMQTAAHA
jgi:hypothetical protein